MRKLLVVFVLVGLAAGAPAQEKSKSWPLEPTAYRNIAFGGTVLDARREIGADEGCICAEEANLRDRAFCHMPEREPVKAPLLRSCRTHFDVAGTAVKDLIHFENDRLVGADMTFDADEFDRMKDIFVEKYGPPASTSNDEVSNRMGAKFVNTSLRWAGSKVTVRLERYGSDLTKSSATIVLTDYMERRAAAMAEEKKKGAKAF